jgi:two-component system response regulator NreC
LLRGQTYLNPRLGGREVEVLKLIALGHVNAEIAAQLYLSVRSVESPRGHIQREPHCTSRAELVRYAIEYRLGDVY